MSSGVKVVWTVLLAAVFFIAGCAAPPQVDLGHRSELLPWRGRLAVRVESDQTQSFSAGFELSGTPLAGELTLYTPLGTTAAALSWTSQTAVLRRPGEVHYFTSLDGLIQQALGAEIPVVALFAWLAGDNMVVAGWNADLSQHGAGRITARRTAPAPAAELRLVLDQ